MKRIGAFILFCVSTYSMGMINNQSTLFPQGVSTYSMGMINNQSTLFPQGVSTFSMGVLNTPQDTLVNLNDKYRDYTTTEDKLRFLRTKFAKATQTTPISREDHRNSAALIKFVSDKSELEYKELKKEATKNLIPPGGYSLRHYNTTLGTMAMGTLCGLGWGYLNKKLFGDSAIKHGILGFLGSTIPLLPYKAGSLFGYYSPEKELAKGVSLISSLGCLIGIPANAKYYVPYSEKEKEETIDTIKKEFGLPEVDDKRAALYLNFLRIKMHHEKFSVGKFFRSLASLGMGIVASGVSIVHTEVCEDYQAQCEYNKKMDKFSKLIEKCSRIDSSLKTDFIKAETREKEHDKLNLFDVTINTVN